jgi:antitoxin HigA-1
MATLKRGEIKRRPTPPGEILKRIYLDENGYTQVEFATLLSKVTKNQVMVSTMKTRLNSVINEKRAMTAEFAIYVSEVLGTNPKMWLNLQSAVDLWDAKQEIKNAS